MCLSVCLYVGVIATADAVWARNLKFGHSTLLMTLKKTIFFFFEILIFSRVMPLFRFSPLPTVLISNRCHSIIYWWIFKSNSSKESCCEVEYEAYDKIHMWWISIAFFAYLNFHFGPIWLVLKISPISTIWLPIKANGTSERKSEPVFTHVITGRRHDVINHILLEERFFYLLPHFAVQNG